MKKIQKNNPKEVNKFVRDVLMSIYSDSFTGKSIGCARKYSEAYNKHKSWRYKWYSLHNEQDLPLIDRMITYTEEIVNSQMVSLFNVSVELKMLQSFGGHKSLVLLSRPVK